MQRGRGSVLSCIGKDTTAKIKPIVITNTLIIPQSSDGIPDIETTIDNITEIEPFQESMSLERVSPSDVQLSTTEIQLAVEDTLYSRLPPLKRKLDPIPIPPELTSQLPQIKTIPPELTSQLPGQPDAQGHHDEQVKNDENELLDLPYDILNKIIDKVESGVVYSDAKRNITNMRSTCKLLNQLHQKHRDVFIMNINESIISATQTFRNIIQREVRDFFEHINTIDLLRYLAEISRGEIIYLSFVPCVNVVQEEATGSKTMQHFLFPMEMNVEDYYIDAFSSEREFVFESPLQTPTEEENAANAANAANVADVTINQYLTNIKDALGILQRFDKFIIHFLSNDFPTTLESNILQTIGKVQFLTSTLLNMYSGDMDDKGFKNMINELITDINKLISDSQTTYTDNKDGITKLVALNKYISEKAEKREPLNIQMPFTIESNSILLTNIDKIKSSLENFDTQKFEDAKLVLVNPISEKNQLPKDAILQKASISLNKLYDLYKLVSHKKEVRVAIAKYIQRMKEYIYDAEIDPDQNNIKTILKGTHFVKKLEDVVERITDFIVNNMNNKELLSVDSYLLNPTEKTKTSKVFLTFYLDIRLTDDLPFNYYNAQQMTHKQMSFINKAYTFDTASLIDTFTKFLRQKAAEVNTPFAQNLNRMLDNEPKVDHLTKVLNDKRSNPDMTQIFIVAEWLKKSTIRFFSNTGSAASGSAKGGTKNIFKPKFLDKRDVCGRMRNVYKDGKRLYVKHNAGWILLKDYVKKMKKKQRDNITFF